MMEDELSGVPLEGFTMVDALAIGRVFPIGRTPENPRGIAEFEVKAVLRGSLGDAVGDLIPQFRHLCEMRDGWHFPGGFTCARMRRGLSCKGPWKMGLYQDPAIRMAESDEWEKIDVSLVCALLLARVR